MDEARLAQPIEGLVGPDLATALVAEYVKIRRDFATKTLERSSIGKFVEKFVQCLQQIATGKHDTKPNVDDYLLKRADGEMALPEGLRICAARLARTMYALRNKRSIAHVNEVSPNTVDLALGHQSAAWILAEMIRNAAGISMEDASAAIGLLQVPVGSLVEEIDGMRLVHADVSIRDELLILMHSTYPDRTALPDILRSLSARNAGSVRNQLRTLRTDKLVVGDAKTGYRLTQAGHSAATAIVRCLSTLPAAAA
jgi:hypothetical protein